MEIAFTKVKLPYGWLGNMAAFPVEYDGKTYATTEALFQALRFTKNPDVQELIRLEKSPMSAKLVAKSKVELMDDGILYSEKDIENMRLCLKLKLEQHPQLKEELLATEDITIIEDCSKRPHGSGLYWGAARTENGWEGKNILGVLWMEERLALKNSLMEKNKMKKVYHGVAGKIKLKNPTLVYEDKDIAKEFANNFTDLDKEPKVLEFDLNTNKILDITTQEGLKTFEKLIQNSGLSFKDDDFGNKVTKIDEKEVDYLSLELVESKKLSKLLLDDFDAVKGFTLLDGKNRESFMVLNTDVLENKQVLEIDLEGDLWKVEFKKAKLK